MDQSRMTRRELIKRGAGTIAAVGVAGAACGSANPRTLVRVPGMDVTAFLRNWFVNRCPLLTRLAWIPVEHKEFSCWSHRYAIKEEASTRTGFFTVGEEATQSVQAFCYPCSPGPQKAASILPSGIRTPLDFNRHIQLQNMADDIETTLYFGGVKSEIGSPRMLGLLPLVGASSECTSPLMRLGKSIIRCRERGGDPDLLLLSTDMRKSLAGIKRESFGKTLFGTPIDGYRSKVFPNQSIVEAPLMPSGFAAVLTSSEFSIQMRINPEWRNYDQGGPAWYCECALGVANRQHHEFLRPS